MKEEEIKETHNHDHNHDFAHEHNHTHEHSASCSTDFQKTSKLDRLLILLLSIFFAVVFLRPFVSFQSLMRGYSYTELGEPKNAIKHLERSIKLDKKNEQAWSLLAYNLNKLGRTNESIKAYKTALILNPKDSQAAIEYAIILFFKKDYRDAIEVLSNHLPESSEVVSGWLLLARCYEKSGQTEKAIDIYLRIYKKIDPGNQVAKAKLESYNAL
ncbi:MAG: tetratricopeptide repeat protein [Actinobacteria bacterium]|nr:tetratricopeptide repeat protein [Actinomycetota bacterium]